ncbi:hypothetical protein PN459_21535 [Microcystis aeruginosa CS-567/02-A1]|uniref:hypothetical protein n=1 Tax=Microcystis aeruginosa TaxID=1126 RepID=UPI002330A339|nr:hypothetical protein [Microcystis aeruginosa]MDB9402538.1 hypothetical protein [Microcystis aeruginosa CS-567/02-A1]
MPRAKKTDIATAPATEISIKEACQHLQTTEQALRLALSHIRPDDFDTVKTLPELDYQELQKVLSRQQLPAQPEQQTATQPQTPAQEENLETAENLTSSALQPSPEKPQNPPISGLASRNGEQLTQSPIPNTQSEDLLTEIDRILSQELSLSDALGEVRNRVILHNLAAKDSELAEELNQRHQARKAAYLSSIRNIASRKQDVTPLTPDLMDLDQELSSIYRDLGK